MAVGQRSNLDGVTVTERGAPASGPRPDNSGPSGASANLADLQGADDLKAIEALAGTSGLLAKTAANVWALRQIALDAATEAILSVTNPAGVLGNPTLTADNQTANRVLAGPTSGGAAQPAFRALVAADIPDVSGTYQPLDSDLTAIAALTTTAFGRGLLALAASVNLRASAGLDATDVPQFARLGLGTAADGTALLKIGTALSGLLLATAGVVTAEGYAFGTFTPTITFATPGDLSVAYTTQVASYQRIGRLVVGKLRVAFTPTYTTAAGNFSIGGLPFTVENDVSNPGYSPAVITATSPTWPAGTTQLLGAALANTTTMLLQSAGSATANTTWTVTQITSGVARDIRITFSYLTT